MFWQYCNSLYFGTSLFNYIISERLKDGRGTEQVVYIQCSRLVFRRCLDQILGRTLAFMTEVFMLYLSPSRQMLGILL
jgi:hypothetical protein